jgi:hypothetical protein
MATPPPNNTLANTPARQRFLGYDYLDFLTNNVKPNSGTFFMTDPRTGGVNPTFQRVLDEQNTLAASRTPARGEQRYGFVRFGQGMDPERRNRSWQEKFSITPGAGLWAIGINPDDPQAEAKAKAYIERQLAANPYDPNAKQTIWGGGQWGRDDAKMPGIRQILAQNPNVSYAQLADYSQRALQTQNALQPRNFDLMTIVDPIITAGLGFINPALSAVYAGGRTAGEGGDFGDILLSAGGGYLGGMGGASLKAGVNAAGGWANYARNIGSSIANAPSNALNYLRYGPEMTSAQFASSMPDWVRSGTAAGMSNAARAAGAIGTANTLSKGADTLGAQAGAKGGEMSWVSDALKTAKDTFGITGGDLLRGGANLISGAMSANAAEEAARMQANAATAGGQLASQTADKQMALLEKMFNKQVELQEPFRQSGVAAQNRMLDLLGLSPNRGAAGYGSLAKNFGMSDFKADPGYAFRMREGLKAVDRQAAARGGLISGGALKAAQNYGQDLASQEYQNAYNRYQTNRTNLLNPLQSLAGAGQTSANTIGNAAAGYGSEGSNALGGAGTAQANAIQNAANARASGYLGSQQSWNQAIQNTAAIPGQSQQNEFMNALMQRYLS